MKTYTTKANARRAAVNELSKSLNLKKEAVKTMEGELFTIGGEEGAFTWKRIITQDRRDDDDRREDKNRRKMAYTKAGDSVPAEDVEYIDQYGTAHCPHCNVHLSNGVQDYESMLEHSRDHNKHNLDKIEPISHEFLCLGCGEEFGQPVEKTKPVARPKVNKSSVDGPCALVWNLAEEMTAKGAARKDVIAEAQKQGVAYYTARTQYQAWRSAKNKS